MDNKRIYILFVFVSVLGFAQPQPRAIVDTTAITIGESIQYELRVQTDSTAKVTFPKSQSFLPFEIIDTTKVFRTSAGTKSDWSRVYTLIQFDSGTFHIPQQKIWIDGVEFLSDSLKIQVHTVEVDTLKQPLFPIKPIIDIEKNTSGWWRPYLLVLVLIGALLTIYFLFIKARNKIRERRKVLPPFERALQALQALETNNLLAQEDYKAYYSSLTDIVRTYLEDDAHVDAMESTSSQLIAKLQLLRDAGNLDLERETIKNLQSVLETADLVKFAKAAPGTHHAAADRTAIESVVKQTKEALPEPTEEEKIMGNVEVRETYKISKIGTIAGCFVTNGNIIRKNKIRLIRDGIVIFTGKIKQLKRFKEDANEVKSGYECGISIEDFNDIKVGDIIESFEIQEIKRKL